MATKLSKRIDSIAIKRMLDDSPDTSWLGDYSDDPKPYAIVARGEHEGEFYDSLPCECNHSEAEHHAEFGTCFMYPDCDCETFNRVTIERGSEYRLFNPGSVETFKPDASWIPAEVQDKQAYHDQAMRQNAKQDYDRMCALNRGNFCFMGISAQAEVLIPDGDHATYTIQRIRSGGLWGIESDSDDAFIEETEQNELASLKTQLHAIGFSKRAIAAAMRDVKRLDFA